MAMKHNPTYYKPSTGLIENDVKRQVKNLLDIYGFFHWYNLQGIGSLKGIPDIIAIRDGRTLFIECKSYPGKTLDGRKIGGGLQSEVQKKFQSNIESHGGVYMIIHCAYDLEVWLNENGFERPRGVVW